MYKVGDKVRIKRTNTIHEIESIVIVDSWSKAKLKGLCFTFSIGELSKDLDMEHFGVFQGKTVFIDAIYPNSEPIKTVPIIPKYEPKLKYVSIDNFKVGDIVEKDGFLFEILEIKLSKFKLKPLSNDFYIEENCKELNKCKELKAGEIIKKTDYWYYNSKVSVTGCEGYQVYDSDVYFRVEKQTQEPEFDFIAIWQKEREFYLIEHKGGEFSRMDKPEFQEYCEKMDRLNVKYRIIE